MTLTIRHAHQSAIPDDGSDVGQTVWNTDPHAVTGTVDDANLASTITAGGPTGSATVVPVITYDVKGRLTAVTTATITQPSAANPTATIGTSAVNGSASTFMRSDAAPPFGNLTGDVTSVGMATTLVTTQPGAHTWQRRQDITPAANELGLSISGGSITGSGTNSPGISITGTLNTSGVVVGAALFANITQTAFGSGSSIYDFQVAGSTLLNLKLSSGGTATNSLTGGAGAAASFNAANPSGNANYGVGSGGLPTIVASQSTMLLFFASNSLNLTVPATATLQLGAANAASPVAQTLQAQGSRAGTDSNVGGANLTVTAGNGTGTGAISSLILQSPVAAASGTGAQTQTTGLTIKGGQAVLPSYTVATLPTGIKGGMAQVTDGDASLAWGATVVNSGAGATYYQVNYNGSNWTVVGK